ncbi:MAG: MMPL family transporter, partial [Chloroflexi bacterium]|nr:MMPL family transporter [Chloroflexota bacterium]
MSNKGWTESLALKCARHPWITVGVWIVALFLAVFSLINLLGDSLVTEQKTTNNPESEQAKTLMNERLGIEESKDLDEMIIVRSKTLTVDDPAYQAQVMGIFGELITLGPDAFLGGVTYYIALDPSLSMDANTLVSADRHTTYIPFKMPPDGDEKINMVYAIGDKYANDTFEIYHTGSAAFMADSIKLGEDTARQGEIIGILAALVVLVIVFGAVVAALLPIALGVVAIIIALGLTGLVGQITDLTFMITNMITMMGLAVGIDYSLFILTRFREERANGRSKIEAIGSASNTAGRAVFFSGVTVMLALTGLIIFPLSIFISLGIGAILVVFAAIIASMTLLPAMLSLFGDKVNALRIPFIKGPVARGDRNTNQGFWAKMSKFVTNNAVASLIITVAILGAAVIPFFDKNTGMSGLSGLPDYLRSKQGYIVLQQEFHTALEDPVLIVIDGDISSPATQSGIVILQKSLADDAAFSSSMVVPYVDKNMAIVYARLGKDSMELSSVEAAGRVRREYIPQAFKDTSVTVLVGGSSAFMFDFNETTANYTPLIFGMVL